MNEGLEKADALFENGRWEQALRLYEEYLARYPEDGHCYTMAARCYLQLKLYGKASEYAATAISVAPEFSYGYYVQAVVYFLRNLDHDATRAINTALELSPTNPDYHVLRARLLAQKNEWQAASEAVDVALGFDPTHADALVVKAGALVRLRKYEEARVALNSVLENDPEDENAIVELGNLHLYLGDWNEAFATFESALALNPESESARTGFMEALRARYPFYGLILRYSLWMNRFSKKYQQSIQYGLSMLMRLIGVIRRQYPALAPILGFILVVWKVFAYLSWTIRAGSTLLLRCNKYGRRLVKPDEVVESNIIGFLWAAALGCWIYHYFFDPFTIFCRLGMIIFLSLPLLVGGAFSAPEYGWPKYASRAILGLMSFAGIVGLFLLSFGFHQEGLALINFYAYGFSIALLVLAFLEGVEPQRS
jgi:tetratricopeptide (TPR) repeat protein